MMVHLPEETFIDLLDGTLDEAAVPHLSDCSACRRQLTELRATLAMAADVDVPEPSPLFWHHLAARIREDVQQEAGNTRTIGLVERARGFGLSWWRVGGLVGAAAAVVMAIALQVPRGQAPIVSTPAAVANEVAIDEPLDAGGVTEPDETLAFVTDLASSIDWDTAADAGFAAPDAADRSVASLTDEERAELRRLLNDAMQGGV